ncbi:MAG: DoxX family protein [Gemmatimonadetes bacterium]|nr:DoxX family protein [Gemmatimonadota bacterium]NIT79147.1 DoxX family protein [Thermoplasmata archaeon]NIR78017.1 DoxX family protein [Gemmatimonadota bacterium]NIU30415.1 DoxX family protein [Gemmatimonadota bacterium]NIU35290.1 DoxX family membrane protein [Gemmatimonadota bacterium]
MNEKSGTGTGQLILRLAIGVIFLTHGLPKLLGGVGATGEFFAQIGIPLAGLAAWLVTLLETFGGALLITGTLVTPIAALLSIHMLLGILLVHLSNGWYVLGPGQGGAEFNVLLIAGLISLMVTGKGSPALELPTSRDEAPVHAP